jgi:hypothetical protein
MTAIELAGDKLAVPAQDGIRPGNGGDVGESLAPQAMADLAEHLSRGVQERQPTIQLHLENAVLGSQIFVPRQHLLVCGPRHVGQHARPIHYRPLPRTDPRLGILSGPEHPMHHPDNRDLTSTAADRFLGRFNFLT